MNLPRLGEVLRQGIALRRPVRLPVVLCLHPFFRADRKVRRIARRGGIELAFEMPAQRRAALRRGPELVPAPQRALVAQRLAPRDGDVADARADVDMALRAEPLQVCLDTGILLQRLDE